MLLSIKYVTSQPFCALQWYRANQNGCALRSSNLHKWYRTSKWSMHADRNICTFVYIFGPICCLVMLICIPVCVCVTGESIQVFLRQLCWCFVLLAYVPVRVTGERSKVPVCVTGERSRVYVWWCQLCVPVSVWQVKESGCAGHNPVDVW